MAFDHQHATPAAEVRFEGDHNKTRAMGPRKAPEAISTQNAPAQARAEISRPIQQQRVNMRENALAASGIKSNTVNTRTTELKPLKEIGQRREAKTQLQHPKNTVQGREKDGIYRATKYYSKLSSIKPKAKLKQPTGLNTPKHIDPDKLLASIEAINALATDIKSSDVHTSSPIPRDYTEEDQQLKAAAAAYDKQELAEALELEDQQLQVVADAYDKQELADLIKKYPASMRKKRGKIKVTPEAIEAVNPEQIIIDIRAAMELAEATKAKKIPLKPSVSDNDDSFSKLEKIPEIDAAVNHLEKAFNAIANDQAGVIANARESLRRNFGFTFLN